LQSNASSTKWINTRWVSSHINFSTFDRSVWLDCQFLAGGIQQSRWSHSKIRSVQMSRRLDGVLFECAHLQSVSFQDATLNRVSFLYAQVEQLHLIRCQLQNLTTQWRVHSIRVSDTPQLQDLSTRFYHRHDPRTVAWCWLHHTIQLLDSLRHFQGYQPVLTNLIAAWTQQPIPASPSLMVIMTVPPITPHDRIYPFVAVVTAPRPSHYEPRHGFYISFSIDGASLMTSPSNSLPV